MRLATSAGSDYDSVYEALEQAKPMMEMETGAADRQGSEDEGEGGVVSVGDWWMEGVMDVGETTVVHVGKTPPSPEPSEGHRM